MAGPGGNSRDPGEIENVESEGCLGGDRRGQRLVAVDIIGGIGKLRIQICEEIGYSYSVKL